MKRLAITLIVVMIVSMGLAAQSQPTLLIDFDKLKKDKGTDNTLTLTDFRGSAGTSFSADELKAMVTSLAIEKWEVALNSSARSVSNQAQSYTKEAVVSKTAKQFAGATILGIRAYFPTEPVNAYAEVKPSFEIPGYADKDTQNADGTFSVADAEKGKGRKFENGLGVVKNVGVLKSIKINAFCLNFAEKLSIILKDQNGRTQEYLMGTFNYDGWRELIWNNPNYVTDVRNRDIQSFPLYPQSAPLLKLEGFRIYKDASMIGGDFVGYIKDVYLTFDKAVLDTPNGRDIIDEDVWNILQKREESRRNAELDRLGNLQVQRYLEGQKMYSDTPAAPAAATTGTTK